MRGPRRSSLAAGDRILVACRVPSTAARSAARRSPTASVAVPSAIAPSAIRAPFGGAVAFSAATCARTPSSSASRTRTPRARKPKGRNELSGGPRNELSGGPRADPTLGLRTLLLERPQHPVSSARGGGRRRGRLRCHRIPGALGQADEALFRRRGHRRRRRIASAAPPYLPARRGRFRRGLPPSPSGRGSRLARDLPDDRGGPSRPPRGPPPAVARSRHRV